MGKSKRKRKLKEEDFKKKKLKVGKRLPMPDNVTKTSFKTQTINIVNQQKQDGGEVTNFKRQTLKDVLSCCSHYNTKAREEALVGLKDLIVKHPNVLKTNLGDILQRVLCKITDIEITVRRAFLSFIWSLFTALHESDIAPFFPNVVANLGSAMTHLNEGIRIDSMKFLDHCLHFFPRLLCTNSKNVVLNLIDAISSEKGGQAKNPGIPKSLRAKTTSQKSQFEVLSRLNHVLRVVFTLSHENNGDIVDTSTSHDTSQIGNMDHDDTISPITSRNLYGTTTNTSPAFQCSFTTNTSPALQHLFTPTTNTSPALQHSFTTTTNTSPALQHSFTTNEAPLVSNFSLKSSSRGLSDLSTSPANLFGNDVNLMEFISRLSPVLFEYWIECSPAEFAMNLIPVKKTSISLQIMKEVLEVLVTLIQGLEKIISEQGMFLKFLKEKLFSQFYTHFLSVFPMSFLLQGAVTKKGKKAEVHGNQGISDVSLNLLICKLLCYFISEAKKDDGTLPKWTREVVNYLSETLAYKTRGSSVPSQITLSDVRSLTKLVKVLVLDLPQNSDDLKTKLLKNVYQLFEATHATSNIKKVLLQFLQDLLECLAHQEMSQEMKDTFDTWLCSLLKITNKRDLGSTFLHNLFSVCKSGIIQRFPNITTVLKDALLGLFKTENFKRFEEGTQLLVVEILYHLKHTPSKQLFEVLITLCNSGTLSLKVFQYLMQVLHPASIPDTAQCSTLANYLSFVLSIMVGQPQSILTRFQKQNFSESYNHGISKDNILVTDPRDYYCCISEDTSDVETLKEIDEDETLKNQWQYQKSMTNIICQNLMQSEFCENFLQMITPSLSKLLNQYTTLSLPVVYRLLCMVKTLLCLAKGSQHNGKNNHGGILVCIAKWCVVIWHFSIALNSGSKYDEFFKIILKDLKELISELCKISSDTLKMILDLLVTYTSNTDNNCTITCQVVTDLLKIHLNDFVEVAQPSLKILYKNLEKAFNAGLVDCQVFSDFKYFNCAGSLFLSKI